MKVLFGALLLPLLISTQNAGTNPYDAAREALHVFLTDGVWFNFRIQNECNHNSIYTEGIKPDHGIEEQMKKIDLEKDVRSAVFLDKKDTLLLFFVPKVSRYFTATKQSIGLFSTRFELTNDQYLCPALSIAQLGHKQLARFHANANHVLSKIVHPIASMELSYSHWWPRAHLHNPIIYQENGQPKRKIYRDHCTEDDVALIRRTEDDQILGASFIEGYGFTKIKYTAVTYDRDLKKYRVKTQFILHDFGGGYEYTHMKDIGMMY